MFILTNEILTCFCVVMLMVEPVEDFAISCMGINELGCILIDGVDVVIGCVTTTVCTITGDSEIVT